MSLADLVMAKKTQRDKDWPMLRRLIEAHYGEHHDTATKEQVEFWLLESRTPEMLADLVDRFPEVAKQLVRERPLLGDEIVGDRARLDASLAQEELGEREVDRLYWEPLKQELEQLRRRL
jgi:hypothetical protein